MNLYVELLALHNTCVLDSSYSLDRKEQVNKEGTESTSPQKINTKLW